MGFGCKHLISFKIWTFIVDTIHRICMQNMSAQGQLVDKIFYLLNISKAALSLRLNCGPGITADMA